MKKQAFFNIQKSETYHLLDPEPKMPNPTKRNERNVRKYFK